MPEERTIDLPHAFDKVWKGARTVFERAKWDIEKADRVAGRFEVIVSLRLGFQIVPRMERLHVDLTRVDENLTRVRARIGAHRLHWGTTRKYVDSFVIELNKILAQSAV